MKLITLPDGSSLVTLRAVFGAGAALDPPGKPGTAWMTALMLGSAGSRRLSYKDILTALFPMGVHPLSSVDKEMMAFYADTHRENLAAYYELFRDALLDPGWREEDFTRVRDEAINFLVVGLRGENDEELGKELLAQEIFRGHPYGHTNAGTVPSLEALTLDDLRRFYRDTLLRGGLTIGIAGGFPDTFPARVEADFAAVPGEVGPANLTRFPDAPAIRASSVLLAEKPSRGVAISLGFPISVRRGDPDFLPLLVATSAFGQHRMSSGRLFNRMRQIRGLNYGDYAYIEHFPGGMYSLEPSPNLGRSHQMFEIWIRPVEPAAARYALRLALFELDRLIRHGLEPEEFERTRSFLSKYVPLLLSTKSAELGYRIDSDYYGIPEYPLYVREGLRQVGLDDVNGAVARHLRTDRLRIAMVAPGAAELCEGLLKGTPSPAAYDSSVPDEVRDEDRTVERWAIPLEDVRVVPVEQVFSQSGAQVFGQKREAEFA